jgi:outer membrane lipoprotein carrier protein
MFFPLLLVLAAAPSATNAETSPQAAPIVRAVENRYHNAKTLKAIFLERYSNARDSLQAESGTVYFSRPGRMRWEYESPETKLFVADGKTVWFFVPSDRTVTRAPMKDSADWRTPLALLTGKAKLSSLCDRIDLASAPAAAGHVVLRCLPRGEGKQADAAAAQATNGDASLSGPDQPFLQVLLEVDSDTGELADVRVLQPGGVELEFRFGNWSENIPLEESLFHFQAPAGVAIVNQSAALP